MLKRRILGWWYGFSYNFGWPDYVGLLDGWVARCAMAVPIVGYLILFNDTVASHVMFDRLAAEQTSAFGLSAGNRLKIIYIGLLFLGAANIIYKWRRPRVMRLATNQIDFVEKGIKYFSVNHYIDFHHQIRGKGIDAYTRHGKYYDKEWDEFMEAATGRRPGDSIREAHDREAGHWNNAKARYEGLLRSILIETFFREANHTGRGWLITCLVLAGAGYLLLAVPSVDLFIKVLLVIISPSLT